MSSLSRSLVGWAFIIMAVVGVIAGAGTASVMGSLILANLYFMWGDLSDR